MITAEEWFFLAKLLAGFALVVAIYAVIRPEEW